MPNSQYLVIEFDDEAQASALRAQIDNATRKGKSYRVVGLFGKPGKTCDCYRDTANSKTWDIRRGSKKGWWICGKCRRAIVSNHTLINQISRDEVISPSTLVGRALHTTAYPTNSLPRKYEFIPSLLSITILPTKGVDTNDQ